MARNGRSIAAIRCGYVSDDLCDPVSGNYRLAFAVESLPLSHDGLVQLSRGN